MKNNLIITVLSVSLFAFTSCKKQKEFTVTNSSSFTIPSSNSVINLPIEVITPETTSNVQTKVDSEGSSSKLIESVILTELNLTINNPTNGNFNFLNSIEIYLSSPNQPEILAAWQYDIAEDNATVLKLNTGNTNLKEYLKESGLTLRTKVVMDKVVSYDLAITADQHYFVKVSLKNIFN